MPGKFVVSKARNGKDKFVLKAANGQVILTSELYESRRACAAGIQSVKKNAGNPDRFEVKQAKDGREYFVLKAANGQTVGKSQMYKSGSGCRNGIKSVGANAPAAEVVHDD